MGRRAELDALAALFEDARLVTLLGPGGMGKTRLALRFCEARLPAFARRGGGGVWIVELAAARTAGELLTTTAAVLGVELAGLPTDAAMADAIGRTLSRRGRTLVVLDNFEQLVGAAGIVDRWLAAAPSARFLVTSRVTLGLGAEVAHAVEPLTTDDATQLFLGRASAVRASADDEDARETARQIVEAIDRMPLAIELAASRTRVLSTTELAARLEHPLAVLSGGRDRHTSIRSAVLDSVALLAEGPRRLFALAASLRNGFTLAAAEAMLAEHVPVLDGLDTLVRSSLLRATLEPGEPTRYGYFETIRDVAEELLADDPLRDVVTAAHARTYAQLAPTLGPHLPRELDNLLAAHATSARLASADAARARDAAEIALALEPLLSARGLSRLRDRLFTEALDAMHAAAADDEATRAEAHLGRGLARRELGEASLARDDFEAALTLARHAGLAGLAAVALTRLGGVLDLTGDTALARDRFVEALALLAGNDDDELRARREAEVYLRLGHAHRREGALDVARSAIEAAVARHRALADAPNLAAALYELAVIEMFAGRTEPALAGFDEGLTLARRSGARLMEGAHTTARGCLLQDLGRLDEALAHHAEAARIFHELGGRYREASALYYLATTHLERGAPDEALAVLHQSRARSTGVGAPRYEALIAGGMAVTMAALGRDAEATSELARAEAALSLVPHEPSLTATLAAHRLALDVRRERLTIDEALAAAEPMLQAAPSDDTRFALRALRQVGRAAVAAEPLSVWGAGEAFQAPGGERVGLPARSPLRRILERLVVARLERPGEAVSIDEIIGAGWPGEKIGADAALNRAYVALATLRRRGLRALLVSSDGGYALSQAVVVRRAG